MNLFNATLRPGKVLEVIKDDNGIANGNIKAYAPGIFSKEDVDKLPPVMPFCGIFGGHANAFSMPKEYDEIWLLHLSDNPRQLYWFRKDDYIVNDSHLNADKEKDKEKDKDKESQIGDIFKNEDVEIICNREVGAGWATIYFSNGDGWVIGKENSKIQIHADGSIEMTTSAANRTFLMNGDGIFLGNNNKYECARGDVTTELMQKIQSCLAMVKQAAQGSPYTTAIAAAIGAFPDLIKEKIPEINSQHVFID